MTVWQEAMEINACGLAELIRYASQSTIIVDCRCFAEFNTSHARFAINAFFSKLMRRRLIENKVDQKVLLDQLSGAHCRTFADDMDVVLYGEDQDKTPRTCQKRRIASLNAPENPAKMLRVLRSQLEETGKFNRIMILEGGFHGFESSYPQLCEGSWEGMSRLPVSLSQPCLSQPHTDGPTQILPFLYLGSQQDALDTEAMKRCGITYVVNLSIGCPRGDAITNDENFLRIPVNDSYQEKLSPYFERAWEFLDKVRENNQVVLIHCLAGISRSPTLAISYVMRYKKLSSEDAYQFVKEKRPSISPNFNFMGQLLEYEQQLIERNILKPDNSSKRCNKPLGLIQHDSEKEDLSHSCPAKVPKSASAHCVFFEPKCEMKSAIRLNENGKRGMECSPTAAAAPDRPKALGLALGMKPRRTGLPDELPSPSSELSKLNFGQGLVHPTADVPCQSDFPTSISNPCFLSPTQPEEPRDDAAGSSKTSYFNKIGNFFRKGPHNMPRSYTVSGSATRPNTLVGVQLKGDRGKNKTSPTLLTTAEEAESPESGYQEEYKTTPDEQDRVSLGSQSSLEIAVQ